MEVPVTELVNFQGFSHGCLLENVFDSLLPIRFRYPLWCSQMSTFSKRGTRAQKLTRHVLEPESHGFASHLHYLLAVGFE